MNKPNLAKFANTVRAVISEHSPEILTGLGIAGMVTTTVLAVRATPKALILIKQRKRELEIGDDDKLTPIDTIKTCWRCYIPAVTTGVASTACLIGASSVNLRRNAALAAAYKLSETTLSEYREKVVETIGEKKEQTVREKVNQAQLDKNPIGRNEIIVTGDGESTFLDPLSRRYFKSDLEFVRKVENKLNKQMLHDICGSVTLNEFYEELGLAHTDIGDDLGWNTEHLIDLDISAGMTEDGKPCLVVGHYNAPVYRP